MPVVFELNLAHNQIGNLTEKTFDGLLQMLNLNLSHNNLTHVPNGVFQGWWSLFSFADNQDFLLIVGKEESPPFRHDNPIFQTTSLFVLYSQREKLYFHLGIRSFFLFFLFCFQDWQLLKLWICPLIGSRSSIIRRMDYWMICYRQNL